MKIKISNISKIHSADIALKGLTVLVGENDTGKSTVGRLLFSAVKALANTNVNNEKLVERQVKKYANSFYKRLGSVSSPIFNRQSDGLIPNLPRRSSMFVDMLMRDPSPSEYIKTIQAAVDTLDVLPRMKQLMKSDLHSILLAISNKDNRAASLYTEFGYLVESEFLNQLNWKSEGERRLIRLDGEDDRPLFVLENVEGHSNSLRSSSEMLDDISYVESPLYLHILDVLRNASDYREINKSRLSLFGMVPYHIKDFALKMMASHEHQLDLFAATPSFSTRDIINGVFDYDEERKAIVFRKDGLKLYPLNVASGAKSFGVLQMLLDGGFIHANAPLVWDEPENHLHPAWQVQFAKLLVQIAKSGVPVMITTHSPYFLQSVRYHAAEEGIEEYVNYYSAEVRSDNKVDFVNVNDRLGDVFRKLAMPLNQIMNVDEVRKRNEGK
jgi:predicted ATPase